MLPEDFLFNFHISFKFDRIIANISKEDIYLFDSFDQYRLRNVKSTSPIKFLLIEIKPRGDAASQRRQHGKKKGFSACDYPTNNSLNLGLAKNIDLLLKRSRWRFWTYIYFQASSFYSSSSAPLPQRHATHLLQPSRFPTSLVTAHPSNPQTIGSPKRSSLFPNKMNTTKPPSPWRSHPKPTPSSAYTTPPKSAANSAAAPAKSATQPPTASPA